MRALRRAVKTLVRDYGRSPIWGNSSFGSQKTSQTYFSVDNYNCHRLTAVRCSMPSGADVIFCSAYMPFNDSSTDYCVEFEAVVGVMQGLADKCLVLVVNLSLVGTITFQKVLLIICVISSVAFVKVTLSVG